MDDLSKLQQVLNYYIKKYQETEMSFLSLQIEYNLIFSENANYKKETENQKKIIETLKEQHDLDVASCLKMRTSLDKIEEKYNLKGKATLIKDKKTKIVKIKE